MKSYLTVILISALLLSSLFFALPKTERLLPFNDKSFNLNKKENEYWKGEFVLELAILPKDRAERKKLVNEVESIIYKRLKKIGVEEIQIVSTEISEQEQEELFRPEEEVDYIYEYLKITIQTTKDENIVKRFVSSNGNIQIMIPAFDSENLADEDKLKMYMAENYTATKWDRNEFRTIIINDLVSSDGDRSYFRIFKPKFTNRSEFEEFIQENKSKSVGIMVDEFVTPIEIQDDSQKIFAIGIGPDKQEAEIQSLLLNTGVFPVERSSIIKNNELEPKVYNVDYLEVTLAVFLSALTLIFFLYKREKEEKEKILQFAFSLLFIFSISLTVLKIWQIPVDLFLLIPTGILAAIFLKTMYTCTSESRIILIMSVLVSAIMLNLGTGYAPILGRFLLFVILLSFLTEILTKAYFKHIKIINS